MRQVIFILSMVFWCSSVHGEQPVFGEMPRWDGGYGVQLVQLFRQQKVSLFDSPDSSNRSIHFSRLDAVYTWDKSIRLTSKLRVINWGQADGEVREDWRGLSALTLALPLKKYFNLDGRSGSFTVAPQVFIPFQSGDVNHPFYQPQRSGLSIGYETETYYYHLGSNVSAWYVTDESTPLLNAEVSTGMNGFFFGFNGHMKVVLDMHRMPSGRINSHLGPTIYGMITDDWHWQLKSRHTASALQHRSRFQSDHTVSLGLGWVQ